MTADAAASAPAFPVPGPEHPGWEDLRRAVITSAQAVELAVREMRHALPSDDARVEMAGLCAGVLDVLAVRVGSIVLDEAILTQRESRAYEQGFAAGLAARRPRRNPGHLRDVSGS